MPVLIAPIAGSLSDRIGGRPLLVIGLALQAIGLGWLAAVTTPTVAYATLVPAFVVSGVGMSLFFAPVANVVLGSVRRHEEGIASGANNAIRELGGVFGVAVLGAVFSARGGYTSGAAFVTGVTSATWVGAAVVAVAAAAALALPRRRRERATTITTDAAVTETVMAGAVATEGAVAGAAATDTAVAGAAASVAAAEAEPVPALGPAR
jgi:MFS family permease